MRRKLKSKQASTIRDILTIKKKEPSKPILLFLTGGERTGKTLTSLTLFQSLLRIYRNTANCDPSQLKGIIATYIGKATFNVGGVTLHSANMPFNKVIHLPLISKKLDTLTKHYHEHHVLVIYEASLAGATLLYHLDKCLQKIQHTPTTSFGNIDIIFSSDL